MEKNIAIRVENLSKAYQLGQIGTGTISRDLERFWTTKIRGKADPFLKIGETNDRTMKGVSDIVWSLKDINFEINQGDAVGIIGRNGAGKSTLLKLLSRVTSPTTGNIKVKGRIASLLEVGTGFHPELTGRENIYLNGGILGMRKKEITRKFDEIVDFSGVERYIDTPVKRYSSGMYVRLAFAVAAHLESEILLVDEVLAVGDYEFQQKCLGKMDDINNLEGRTIIFVSHNISSINQLCNVAILLENGQISYPLNDVALVTSNYLSSRKATLNNSLSWKGELGNKSIIFHSTNIFVESENDIFDTSEDVFIEISFTPLEKIEGLILGFQLISEFSNPLAYTLFDDNPNLNKDFKMGVLNKVLFKIPKFTLAEGIYNIEFDFGVHMIGKIVDQSCNLSFEIQNYSKFGGKYIIHNRTPLRYSILRPDWFMGLNII